MTGVTTGDVQTLFEAVPGVVSTDQESGVLNGSSGTGKSEAKRSIHYMVEVALRYGKMGGLKDLLDSVAGFRQYNPYNALLVLLQIPAATYVLPAHRWGERFGRVILPNEQPLVMLQRGGPVMFLFDISQTEEGPNAMPLPVSLKNPFGMADIPESASALAWVIQNAKADGVRVSDAGLGLRYGGCVTLSDSGGGQRVEVSRRPPVEATVSVRYDVLLNKRFSPTEQLSVLAHELGHLYCGHLGAYTSQLLPDNEVLWTDRPGLSHASRELEADSVSRLVFRALAPGEKLPKHLEQAFSTTPELGGLDLERVLSAAGRVLDMAKGHAPRRPKQKARKSGKAAN